MRSPNSTCSPFAASTWINAVPVNTSRMSENSTPTSRLKEPRVISPSMPVPQTYGVTLQSQPWADADDADKTAITHAANLDLIVDERMLLNCRVRDCARCQRLEPRRGFVPPVAGAPKPVAVVVER